MSDAPTPPGSAESGSWNGREVWLWVSLARCRQAGAGGGRAAGRCAARGRGSRREEPEEGWRRAEGRPGEAGLVGGRRHATRIRAARRWECVTRRRSAGGLPTGSRDRWKMLDRTQSVGTTGLFGRKAGKREERMTLRLSSRLYGSGFSGPRTVCLRGT